MSRVDEYSLPGSPEVYQETLVAGTITVKTGFAEIYEAKIEMQSGQQQAGGEHLFDRVVVNGNVSAGANQGDRGVKIMASGDGRITKVRVFADTLGNDDATSIQYAFGYDASGPTYTDETADAKSATDNDVALLPATPAVGDAFYWGSTIPFQKISMQDGTDGVGTWTLTYYYYDGSAWTELTVTDGTSAFTNVNGEITWTIPSDWASTTVNSQAAFWIKAEVATYSAVTTQPLVKSIDLGYSLIVDVNVAGTTIFTTQSNRLVLYDDDADEAAEVNYSTIEAPTFSAGDYITVDVDYVAAGTAAADMVVEIWVAFDDLGPREQFYYTISTVSGDTIQKIVVNSDNPGSTSQIQINLRGRK